VLVTAIDDTVCAPPGDVGVELLAHALSIKRETPAAPHARKDFVMTATQQLECHGWKLDHHNL
jgi:hypothetical protein